MPRITARRAIIVMVAVVLTGLAYLLITQDSPEEKKFKRIVIGMSIEEVEAILGPGEQVKQANVPSYRIAVNPEEEDAFRERHRKAGTVPTVREYETRNKHFVEGEVIYHWESGYYDSWIAFKRRKVCEKYLDFWGYL